MHTVNRFDFATAGRTTRTPQGFLRVDARLSRTGVLEYRRADGTVRRELRHPDEVFKVSSLATLSSAPLTHLHPREMVTPRNVRATAIGHVSETVKRDGRFVASEVVVQDADAIEAVERGELRELSCGYRCDLDETPGAFEGERYDAVQRNITYNHVALLPPGGGRAGSDVGLRLDSADAISASALDAPHAMRSDGGSSMGKPMSEDQLSEVNRRVGLIMRVRAHNRAGLNGAIKNFAPTSSTERDLMIEALKLAVIDLDKAAIADKPDDYVRGLFDSEFPPLEGKKDSRDLGFTPPWMRQWDAPAPPRAPAPRADARSRLSPAPAPWEQPLSVTTEK